MSHFRKLLLAGVGVLALHGAQACAASESELNPQPLPPQGEVAGDPTRSPSPEEKAGGDDSNASGGAGATTPAPSTQDGGAEGGDASDAGAD